MKIDKIVMMVKRVQYQSVEISSEAGYNMPQNLNELVEFCEATKANPLSDCKSDTWFEEEPVEITSFEIKEEPQIDKQQ